MAAATVLRELNAAVGAADHLQGATEFAASIELARTLARQIDAVRGEAPAVQLRVTNVAIPTLHKVLTGLGLTPEGLKRLQGEAGEDVDELESMRSERAGLRSV